MYKKNIRYIGLGLLLGILITLVGCGVYLYFKKTRGSVESVQKMHTLTFPEIGIEFDVPENLADLTYVLNKGVVSEYDRDNNEVDTQDYKVINFYSPSFRKLVKDTTGEDSCNTNSESHPFGELHICHCLFTVEIIPAFSLMEDEKSIDYMAPQGQCVVDPKLKIVQYKLIDDIKRSLRSVRFLEKE